MKVNDNVYSGFAGLRRLRQSDVRYEPPSDLRAGLHLRNVSPPRPEGCTSHHIRVETLDALVKDYVRKVRDNSSTMLERLNADLAKEQADICGNEAHGRKSGSLAA